MNDQIKVHFMYHCSNQDIARSPIYFGFNFVPAVNHERIQNKMAVSYRLVVSLVVIFAGVIVGQHNEPVHCCVDTKFTVVESK